MSQFNSPTSPGSPGPSSGGAVKRNAVLITGGAALVAIGLAAGLAFRPAAAPSEPPAPLAATAVPATANTATPNPAPVASNMAANDSMAPAPVVQAAPPPAVQPAPAVPAPPVHRTARVARAEQQGESPVPQPSRHVAVCNECGTVEAVTPVKVKGSGSGIGAVAGGVVGGALANQLGHGNGKAALTVLGAIGGGLAGNETEKHVRATTMYDVQVRMEDGSYRTLREASAPPVGERVRVEGDQLRARN